jgi:hypothetical protein
VRAGRDEHGGVGVGPLERLGEVELALKMTHTYSVV